MRGQAAARAARIYTIPAGRPFLETLARALIAGDLPTPGGQPLGPVELADVTLLLPTRRAAHSLEQAFLSAARGAALLLPKVRPIFASAEEFALPATIADPASDAIDGLRPAVGARARQLALARLVLAWGKAQRDSGAAAGGADDPASAARTAAQAANLARELAHLIDAMEIAGVAVERLRALPPDALAEHWEHTLAFLAIVTEHWPAHLAERGLISAVGHDKQLIRALIARLRDGTATAPVIVAGVMSSTPIVAELLAAVASLPNGAIVLPGLDTTLDAPSWDSIVPRHPEHPQFGLKRMLDSLGLAREDVGELPGAGATPMQRARAAFLSEAMRPAHATEHWQCFAANARREELALACAGMSLLAAPSAEDEAEAVALILRHAAETPGRTAALVTPDRTLARRVTARLACWGIDVADSAGQPLSRTVIGSFLELVVAAAAGRLRPVALMSLLQHPLCAAGMDAARGTCARRTLELAVLRAPYFGEGLDDLAQAAKRARAEARLGRIRGGAVLALTRADWQAGDALVAALLAALRPLEALLARSGEVSLHTLVAAHVAACEALGRDGARDTGSLWQGAAGEAAAQFLAELLDPMAVAPQMPAADYTDFYRSVGGEVMVKEEGSAHPHIHVLEPYAARLQQFDVVVLGSLNEGDWPAAADAGPWLSRPMRQALGLPAPEERIGDSAHIFASLFGAERVYLTRAVKRDGVPMVPSRWLLRMEALLGGAPAAADPPYLAWAAARNRLAAPPGAAQPPRPRPPISLRPRRLSVTAVETWMANPYALYARRILGLEPLPRLGRRPDALLRGEIVHAALSAFAKRFPERLPSDPQRELIACAEAALNDLTGSPRVAAFWAPRFARFAAWFAATEPGRRTGVAMTLAEIAGERTFAAPAGPFTLTARADRIDLGADGVAVTDYKTGSNVKERVARALAGLEPQLALEAAIAAAGGFPGVTGSIAALRYIATPGGEPPGAECALGGTAVDLGELAREAEAGLLRLIAAFDASSTPYTALRRPRFAYRFDAYAHLARVAEWSLDAAEEQ
jgi:ATP-dependent helicase/nuclease subunit B